METTDKNQSSVVKLELDIRKYAYIRHTWTYLDTLGHTWTHLDTLGHIPSRYMVRSSKRHCRMTGVTGGWGLWDVDCARRGGAYGTLLVQ